MLAARVTNARCVSVIGAERWSCGRAQNLFDEIPRGTLQDFVPPKWFNYKKLNESMACIFSPTAPFPAFKHLSTRVHLKKQPKNLRSPRRSKLPPDFGVNLFLNKPHVNSSSPEDPIHRSNDQLSEVEEEDDKNSDPAWEADELEAISSLFQGRVSQKPGKLGRERPLPLPVPHKLRPLRLPTPKKNVKLAAPAVASSRAPLTKQLYKNPNFLVGLAREVKGLAPQEDVSSVLDKWARFLRRGSLSLTIKELGHMGLPDRALQTFRWAQKQPLLFPDDRILASTIEVLAKNHELKVPANLDKFISLASRSVIEAMVRGFIAGGSLRLAWKVLSIAKHSKRVLDPGIYAKLILALGKNPENSFLVVALLDELGERGDLSLTQPDCTAIMKVCIRLGRFDVVESLFNWFKQSGHTPSVVMYTTLVHSHFTQNKYREALAVVWDMEASECLFDLPAYRVGIKLFVALNDLARAVRYFSKLKEAGFSPTYDIYRDLINIYMASGRIAKCKEVYKEAEMAGFKLELSDL